MSEIEQIRPDDSDESELNTVNTDRWSEVRAAAGVGSDLYQRIAPDVWEALNARLDRQDGVIAAINDTAAKTFEQSTWICQQLQAALTALSAMPGMGNFFRKAEH